LHHGRSQLARKSDQLLNPMRSKGKQTHSPKQAAAITQRFVETNLLLDCMDDLLLQISILRTRLDELQENTFSEGERHENTELLECLEFTTGHIYKHKEILESGEVFQGKRGKGGARPNHLSVLQSAHTWKITLLTVVDTLAKRQHDAALDKDIDSMDFELMRETKRRSPETLKASSSLIDDIEDGETRRRLLLNIGNGVDVGLKPSGGRGNEGCKEAINGIRMLRLQPMAGPGVDQGGGSPLPGLSELGIL